MSLSDKIDLSYPICPNNMLNVDDVREFIRDIMVFIELNTNATFETRTEIINKIKEKAGEELTK